MLVLGRKKNETIHLDGGIVIHVLEVPTGGGSKVKIGIEAPASLQISRGELLGRDQKGKEGQS